MFCVGLTGNIGSGKSVAAREFAALGADVVSADAISKALTAKGESAFDAIIKHFGPSVCTPSGELNRKHLRQIVFSKTKERIWLENLLHPLIRRELRLHLNRSKGPYCVMEIPLLNDRTSYPYLSRVLLILSTKEQQIERLTARDKSSEEEASAILATQAKEDTLRALADDVVLNTGSLLSFKDAISALNQLYLRCAEL